MGEEGQAPSIAVAIVLAAPLRSAAVRTSAACALVVALRVRAAAVVPAPVVALRLALDVLVHSLPDLVRLACGEVGFEVCKYVGLFALGRCGCGWCMGRWMGACGRGWVGG